MTAKSFFCFFTFFLPLFSEKSVNQNIKPETYSNKTNFCYAKNKLSPAGEKPSPQFEKHCLGNG